MTYWLVARRWRWCAVSIAAVSLLLLLLGDVAATVPALFSVRGLALPVALLAPLAVSTVVGYGLAAGDEALESVAVRPVAALDTAYALVAGGAVLAAGGLMQAVGLAELGIAAGRNALGFVSLLLIGRWLLGGYAAPLLPTMVFVLLAFFGADAAGEPRWWAWALIPFNDPRSWLITIGLLVAGSAVSVLRWRSPLAAG